MSRLSRFAMGAALVAGFALASTAFAADDPKGPGMMGGPHGAPSGGFHGGMPPRGFHGAPPGFHGSLPSGAPTGAVHHAFGVPGHDMGMFHGHDFGHFTPTERDAWQHGGWQHTWHNGHHGWWWVVGGFWFFYPEPIYPYPLYIGPEDYYDYYYDYGTPPYYWYHCDDPQGYYPNVQQCNVPWEPVPPTPDNE